MGRYITRSADETVALAEKLGRTLHGGELIFFLGEMGSGKTTFCKGLAKGLGTLDEVSSPTYAIAHYHRGPTPFAHFDAWRISGVEDLETAGFFDYLNTGAVIAVEWSEKMAAFAEKPAIQVALSPLPDGSREIIIEGAPAFEPDFCT
ncbi:tRNA (adenosine(37)-N6)-threonylcarbamoyltransferase complex ATPase subunit type 1 TsaE [Ruminococcaceae bacterium OttesenSCG-928-I18]|nr:tRNA (adenosine(37)-N6)-threonylcarbamoyltransferase complex ATPase subunit type 1 TsaE [Ruminococcaceae bacterium OttesenSCG-928-I18]